MRKPETKRAMTFCLRLDLIVVQPAECSVWSDKWLTGYFDSPTTHIQWQSLILVPRAGRVLPELVRGGGWGHTWYLSVTSTECKNSKWTKKILLSLSTSISALSYTQCTMYIILHFVYNFTISLSRTRSELWATVQEPFEPSLSRMWDLSWEIGSQDPCSARKALPALYAGLHSMYNFTSSV